MNGWGSDKKAYEMETQGDDSDARYEKATKEYQKKQISEDVGEW